MTRFLLENIPTLWLGMLVVGVTVGVSLLGLVLVRRRIALRTLESHKEVAGFIIAVIGVIYAVLLAFVVVIVWEQFRSTEGDVATEAAAVGNVYRDAEGLGTQGSAVQAGIRRYAISVVDVEWPRMAAGHGEAPPADAARDATSRAVTKLHASDGGASAALIDDMVKNLSEISNARRMRLLDSEAEVPTPLWAALLIGGVITIGFTLFFGVENRMAAGLMVSSLAALIGLAIFVILTLDLPFTGDISVKPTAMQAEMAEFAHYQL